MHLNCRGHKVHYTHRNLAQSNISNYFSIQNNYYQNTQPRRTEHFSIFHLHVQKLLVTDQAQVSGNKLKSCIYLLTAYLLSEWSELIALVQDRLLEKKSLKVKFLHSNLGNCKQAKFFKLKPKYAFKSLNFVSYVWKYKLGITDDLKQRKPKSKWAWSRIFKTVSIGYLCSPLSSKWVSEANSFLKSNLQG